MYACTKVAYASRDRAMKAVRGLGRRGKRMRAYLCFHCHDWHMTSEVERKWNSFVVRFKDAR